MRKTPLVCLDSPPFTSSGLCRIARERISDYEALHKYTEKLLKGLKRAIAAGEAVDVQDMFSRFTMDAAGEFLFGTSDFNTLDLPFPKASEAVLGPKGIATDGHYGSFVKAFEQGQANTRGRFGKPTPLWAALEFFHDTQADTNNVIQAYLDPLIRKALDHKARRAAGKADAEEEVMSFLDHLALSSDGERGSPTARKVQDLISCCRVDVGLVRDQLINMLLAARDTVCSDLPNTLIRC